MSKKIQSTIHLLLFLSLLTTACELSHPIDGQGPTRGPQFQAPLEGPSPNFPCDCDAQCRSFYVEPTMEPALPGYAFAIRLTAVNQCVAEEMQFDNCMYRGKRYEIGFSFEINDPNRFELSDFDEVLATGTGVNSQQKLQVWENPDGNSMVVFGGSNLHFKWKPGHEHSTPTLDKVITGGVCIVSVVSDPCCPDPRFRGRPMRPLLLNPWRP